MYHGIRIIAAVAIVWGAAAFLKKFIKMNKRSLIVTAVLLGTALTFALLHGTPTLPFERFESPQKAFSYASGQYHPKVMVTLEGEHSAQVCAQNTIGGELFIEHLNKRDGLWQPCSARDFSSVFVQLIGETFVDVCRYSDTADYYISIYTKQPLEVSDCRASEFSTFQAFSSETGAQTCCYAYVHDMDSEYWLEINGKQIYPLK